MSDVQRRQMTTVDAPNVHNVAVEGTFDDCQDLVKALFADVAFRDDVRLSAMNSINWARVMAQIVYYVTAAARSSAARAGRFAVPTGNFGNVFAGWVARADGRCRSTSSSSARTATTSSPAGSPTGALDAAARSCPRSARAWTSRCRRTSSGCCSSCSAATARATAELLDRFRRGVGVGRRRRRHDRAFDGRRARRRRDARP